MRERYYEAPNGNKTTILLVIIKPNFALANNCIVPPCYSCLLARARNRTPNVWRTCLLNNCDGALTRDQYNKSDFVSTEQFICKMPGRLPTSMDVNHNIAIFRAVLTSLMMQHQYSNGSRKRFLLVLMKQLWVRLVSNSGFTTNESAK